jgi:staphylococcal nuclease domain-containing protein 1
VSIIGNKVPANIEELEQAEQQAKAEGLGIWGSSLRLLSSSPKKVRQNERIAVEMTDISDASRFFVKIISENQYPKIEVAMNKFDEFSAQDLEKPIKKGTICAARFKLDECWYRARILRGTGKNQFDVEFIDFGN